MENTVFQKYLKYLLVFKTLQFKIPYSEPYSFVGDTDK